MNTDGIHKVKWLYDQDGNVIEEAYYNQGNKESPLRGVLKYKWFYDDKNNRIKEEVIKLNQEKEIYNYDPIKEEEKQETKLCLHLQIPSKEERMNLANKVIENTVKKDSKEFRIRSTYDDKGNLIQKEIIKGEGELYPVDYRQKRIRKIVWKYNKNDYPNSEEYFDLENKPTEKIFGGSMKAWSFDKYGNLKSYKSLDKTGGLSFDRFVFRYDKKCIGFIKEKFKNNFGEKNLNCLIEKIGYDTKENIKYRLSRILKKNESSQNEIPFETILFNESRFYEYYNEQKGTDFSEFINGVFIQHSKDPRNNLFIEFDNNHDPVYMGLENKVKAEELFLNRKNDYRLYLPNFE